MRLITRALVTVSVVTIGMGAMAEELEIARNALRDGLYEIARIHAGNVITNDAAKLVILESYAAEDRWNEIRQFLDEYQLPADDNGFAYYRLVLTGDFDKAAKLLEKQGSVAGANAARLMRASIAVRQHDMNSARKLWQEIVSDTNAAAQAYVTAALNLGEVEPLRRAMEMRTSAALRRRLALRLGVVLLGKEDTAEEGAKQVRLVVKDSPDTEGAREAYLSLAETQGRLKHYGEALKIYGEVTEIWPDMVKIAKLQLGRGEMLLALGRNSEAIANFKQAETLASEEVDAARAVLRQGDALSAMGKDAEALAKYREMLTRFPKTELAKGLEKLVMMRELELKGREAYGAYRFEEAQQAFHEVAKGDPTRAERMAYCQVMCMYGRGRDDEARSKAEALLTGLKDVGVRKELELWLAKFAYNRHEWKKALEGFLKFSRENAQYATASSALLWAARSAASLPDAQQAIAIVTELAERYPNSAQLAPALIVQSQALIELARYDEAILVLERALAIAQISDAERIQASLLRADAFFAMGADNPVRYQSALEAYQQMALEMRLDAERRLVVAFKIARTLEKLRRKEEAVDQYYTQVVLAYRNGRARGENYDDDAKAAFSKAAFRLADLYEESGRDVQALNILELVAFSDVPAAEEAIRRISKISTKGRFL